MQLEEPKVDTQRAEGRTKPAEKYLLRFVNLLEERLSLSLRPENSYSLELRTEAIFRARRRRRKVRS